MCLTSATGYRLSILPLMRSLRYDRHAVEAHYINNLGQQNLLSSMHPSQCPAERTTQNERGSFPALVHALLICPEWHQNLVKTKTTILPSPPTPPATICRYI